MAIPRSAGWITAMFMLCRLGSHPWQHAVFGDLREERRGRVRTAGLSAVSFRRWIRAGDDPDRDDVALRHGIRCADSDPGRQRRDRRRPGCLFRALSQLTNLHPRPEVSRQHPAWFFLGGWFVYQFFAGDYGLLHPSTTGSGGVAFFAHVGGFVFGAMGATILMSTGRITAREAGWTWRVVRVTGTTLLATPG
jgi:Rhomboid family